MSNRRGLVVAAACAAALLGAYCSEEKPKPPVRPDAATVEAECTTSDDCNAGDCVDKLCTWCLDTTCPAGTTCSQNGKCVGCDGGCESADVSVPVDAGKTCANRTECNGLACRAGLCAPQDPSGACTTAEECNAGFTCTVDLCTAGCTKKADCAGALAGPRCDTVTGRCGPCAEQADCAATENCVDGKCALAAACPAGDRAPCGALACLDKLCRPCVAAVDCGAGYECKDGKCLARAGCTDDQQCKTLTAGHWCDKASSLCKWGCLAGGAAACGQNCCPPRQGCNTTTKSCEDVPCNNCNGSCIFPQSCDTNSCTCITAGPDAGAGPKCNALNCSCANGKTCVCSLGACSVPLCGVNGTCQ